MSSTTNLPRMADYALWGEACCSAWWPPGTFIKAYRQNLAAAVELSIQASPVATAVKAFMANRTDWSGTAEELLVQLTATISEKAARSRGWPSLPHLLSGQLRRAAPNLRKIGIQVEWSSGHHYGRQITITKNGDDADPRQASEIASPASPAARDGTPIRDNGDGRDARDAGDTENGAGDGARRRHSGGNGQPPSQAMAAPTCACCGKASPVPNEVAVDGVTVWLHRDCEPAYLDIDPQPRWRQ